MVQCLESCLTSVPSPNSATARLPLTRTTKNINSKTSLLSPFCSAFQSRGRIDDTHTHDACLRTIRRVHCVSLDTHTQTLLTTRLQFLLSKHKSCIFIHQMLLFVILYLEHPFFIVLHFNQFLKTEVKHDYDLPVDLSVLLLSATGRRADETSPVHVCRRSGKYVSIIAFSTTSF